jgi:hypothetical protein
MKQVSLKTTNKKKLELKKTAIANLQMSEGQMRMLIGGKLTTGSNGCGSAEANCDPTDICINTNRTTQ